MSITDPNTGSFTKIQIQILIVHFVRCRYMIVMLQSMSTKWSLLVVPQASRRWRRDPPAAPGQPSGTLKESEKVVVNLQQKKLEKLSANVDKIATFSLFG